MVIGLVYTEVPGNADQTREVFRIKRALTTGAQRISRMRAGTPGNNTAYANKPGRSLLRSIRTMEKKLNDQATDLLTLQKKVDDQESDILALRKKDNEQETEIVELQKRDDQQDYELMMLRPLKDTTIDIRKRFFATHIRKKGEDEPEDTATIMSGNLRAHAGDVCLDASLFKNGLIEEYDDTFSSLYGLSWSTAESLLGMLPTVFSGGCGFGRSAISLFELLTKCY